MLSTNRISIKNEDLSASLISTASKVLGYTVVDAEKGPCKPVKISAGSSEKIHSIFGYTSAKYHMIQEALDFKGNMSKQVYVIDGVQKPLSEWCEEYGITAPAVMYRMKKKGMNFEEALTSPKSPGSKIRKK